MSSRKTYSILKALSYPSPHFLPAYYLSTVLLFIITVAVTFHYTSRCVADYTQRLNWDIAAHIAADLTYIPTAEGPLPRVLNDLVELRPAIKAYVLDPDGRVLFPKTVRDQVDLTPILKVLDDHVPNPPIWGEDPSDPYGTVIFSAAPLAHGLKGYLYAALETPGVLETGSFHGQLGIVRTLILIHAGVLLLWILEAGYLAKYVRRRFMKVGQMLSAVDQPEDPLEDLKQKDEISILCRDIASVASGIRDRTKRLARMAEQRRELLAAVVHDLRGPLSGLRAAAEMLRRDWVQEGPKAYLSSKRALEIGIAAQTRYLDQLSDVQVQNLAADQIAHGEFELFASLEELIARSRPRALSLGVELLLNAPRSDVRVIGDEDLLERAFANLIDNALRHTARNGRIEVTLEPISDRVQISVSDTGEGIAPEDLPFIFNAFFQGGVTKRGLGVQHGGAGLGLANVKKIAALHGSHVEVRSKVGEGTTFTFSLPTKHETAVVQPEELASARQPSRRFGFTIPSRLYQAQSVLSVMLLIASWNTPSWHPLIIMLPIFSFFVFCVPETSARERTWKRRLSAIWWSIAIAFSVPIRTGVFIIAFWSLFLAMYGFELGMIKKGEARAFSSVLIIAATIFWFIFATHPGIPGFSGSISIVCGLTLAQGLQQNRKHGLTLRLFGIAGILSVALVATQTYLLDLYWIHLEEQSEITDTNGISSQVARRMKAAEATKSGSSSEGLSAADLMAHINLLLPALDFAYVDSDGGNHSGTYETAFALSQLRAWYPDSDITANFVAREKVDGTVFEASPNIEGLFTRLSETNSLPLFYTRPAQILKVYRRKIPQPYIVAVLLILLAWGAFVVLALWFFFAKPVDRIVRKCRRIVAALGTEKHGEMPRAIQAAEELPLMAALAGFSQRANQSWRALAREDENTRETVNGAVSAIAEMRDAIAETIGECEKLAVAEHDRSVPPEVVRLNVLLKAQSRLVDLLFQIAQEREAGETPATAIVQLDELIEDITMELAAYGAQKDVALRIVEQGAFSIRSDPRLLSQAMGAVLHDIINKADAGTHIDISICEKQQKPEIRFHCEHATGHVRSNFNRDESSRYRQDFSIQAAEQLLRRLGASSTVYPHAAERREIIVSFSSET